MNAMTDTKQNAARQNLKAQLAVAATAVAGSGMAAAGTMPTGTDPFTNFMTTVEGWAHGPLGIGLSITSVLVGAGHAIGKNAPMSALTGVALAALVNWGPDIIISMMTGGAVLM